VLGDEGASDESRSVAGDELGRANELLCNSSGLRFAEEREKRG